MRLNIIGVIAVLASELCAQTTLINENFDNGLPSNYETFGFAVGHEGGVRMDSACVTLPGTFTRNAGLVVEASVTIMGPGDFNIWAFVDTADCRTALPNNAYDAGWFPTSGDNHEDRLTMYTEGNLTILAATPVRIIERQNYHLKIEFLPDGTINQYIGETKILTTNNNNYNQGKIILRSSGPVDIDNLKVATLPPTCTYTIDPTGLNVGTGGLSGTIAIDASQQTCAWSATPDPTEQWVSFTTPTIGTGDGSVQYIVGANPATPRTATLTVAGKSFAVSQQGITLAPGQLTIACDHPYGTFTVSPPIPPATTGGSCYPGWSFNSVPGGTYTVTFNPVPSGGYTPPAGKQFLINGNDITFDVIYRIIPGSTVDTDEDGLPDEWEITTKFLDGVDHDFPAMGAKAFRKDIFIQVDWLDATSDRSAPHSHQPPDKSMHKVIRAFLRAPIRNPDGSYGINLHVDYDPLSVMNPSLNSSGDVMGPLWGGLSRSRAIRETQDNGSLGKDEPQGCDTGTRNRCEYNWTEFENIRDMNTTRFSPRAFHYVISGHCIANAVPNGLLCDRPKAGLSEGVSHGDSNDLAKGAGEFIVALRLGDPVYSQNFAATFMHELGHNLGLSHGGKVGDVLDHAEQKPNYPSVMNYLFSDTGIPVPQSGQLLFDSDLAIDYSRISLIDLDPTTVGLRETVGLGPNSWVVENVAYRLGTYYFCSDRNYPRYAEDSHLPIDWNCRDLGDHGGNTTTPDLNPIFTSIVEDGTRSILRAPKPDWSEITFTGGSIGRELLRVYPLFTTHDEPTWEFKQKMRIPGVNIGVTCQGDVNGDKQTTPTDVQLVTRAMGSVRGSPGYKESLDVFFDGAIDGRDVSLVARDIGCKK